MHIKKAAILLALSVSLTACSQDTSGSGSSSQQESQITADSSADSTETEDNGDDESEVTNVSEQYTDTDGSVSQEIFAMDTYMVLKAYGSQASEAVTAGINEIQRIDALLSTGSETSEITALNAEGGGVLSEDTEYLIRRSLALYEQTGGAFDISIYPVMKLWGFAGDEFHVPEAEDLKETLSLVDASKLTLNGEEHSVHYETDGMEIDLGGIAKGYTSARIAEIFQSYGVESGLLNLGGNVQAIGTKTDGTLWKVGIQNPDGDGILGTLTVENRAVITSGGYERYFTEGDKEYHHIIDPSTGYPAENGIVSSTIVSSDGTLADGLSTSLYIMGLDQAIAYWQNNSDSFDFILVDDSGTVYVTENISEDFSSEREVIVIEKE